MPVIERLRAALERGDRSSVRAVVRDDVAWLTPDGVIEEPDAVAARLGSMSVERVSQHGARALLIGPGVSCLLEIRADGIVFGADLSR